VAENNIPVLGPTAGGDKRTARLPDGRDRAVLDLLGFDGPPVTAELDDRVVGDDFVPGDLDTGGGSAFGNSAQLSQVFGVDLAGEQDAGPCDQPGPGHGALVFPPDAGVLQVIAQFLGQQISVLKTDFPWPAFEMEINPAGGSGTKRMLSR
jgi:hypothetical protein